MKELSTLSNQQTPEYSMNNTHKYRVCKCGGSIPFRTHSTIQSKLCPKCTYQEALRKPRKATGLKNKSKSMKLPSEKQNALKTPHNASYYMRQADKWFSRYVRLIFTWGVIDGEPYCKDIITGKAYSAKNLDCGHFISRANMATRYDLNNCRPQNRSSNRFRGEADKEKFRDNLVKEIGIEEMGSLMNRSKSSVKLGMIVLKGTADYFHNQVNELVKSKKIKKWW